MTDSTPFTNPEPRPPVGPRWLRGLNINDTQTDGRGTLWRVAAVSDGGRVVKWITGGYMSAVREAITTCTPTHPDYPTDEYVITAKRAAARAVKAAAQTASARSRWYP